MAAISRPLVLWAPSFQLAEAHKSPGLDMDMLVRLIRTPVQQGCSGIRIAAREDWLMNGSKRRESLKNGYQGAAWTTWDKDIERIYLEDRDLDVTKRRVFRVDEEDGYDRAKEFFGARPEKIPKVEHLIEMRRVPPETLERIERRNLKGDLAAIEVARDARNHQRAIFDAGGGIPFLDMKHARFLDLMNEIDAPALVDDSQVPIKRGHARRRFVNEMLDVLEELARLGQPDLETLLKSPAHAKLASWMTELIGQLQYRNLGEIEPEILETLYVEVDKNFPKFKLGRLTPIGGKGIKPFENIHLIFELIAMAIAEDCWSISALLLGVMKHARLMLERLGIFRVNAGKAEGLFLYAFGRKPRMTDMNTLHSYLKLRLNGHHVALD
jgi:hypothetical protein